MCLLPPVGRVPLQLNKEYSYFLASLYRKTLSFPRDKPNKFASPPRQKIGQMAGVFHFLPLPLPHRPLSPGRLQRRPLEIRRFRENSCNQFVTAAVTFLLELDKLSSNFVEFIRYHWKKVDGKIQKDLTKPGFSVILHPVFKKVTNVTNRFHVLQVCGCEEEISLDPFCPFENLRRFE
jgi:hypothetical protein